jgi:hypothetical protein
VVFDVYKKVGGQKCELEEGQLHMICSDVSKEREPGGGLLPLKDVIMCLSCNDNKKLYMETESRNSDFDDAFKKWITKKEAVEVLDSFTAHHI